MYIEKQPSHLPTLEFHQTFLIATGAGFSFPIGTAIDPGSFGQASNIILENQ